MPTDIGRVSQDARYTEGAYCDAEVGAIGGSYGEGVSDAKKEQRKRGSGEGRRKRKRVAKGVRCPTKLEQGKWQGERC